MRDLLGHGADIAALTSSETRKAIDAAARKGYTDIVKTFVSRRADIKGSPTSLARPLLFAAQAGHLPIVQLLLDNGADVDSHLTGSSATALIFAWRKGHTEIVKFLESRGAMGRVVTTLKGKVLKSGVWGITIKDEITSKQILLDVCGTTKYEPRKPGIKEMIEAKCREVRGEWFCQEIRIVR
jgi:hypothetical protein